MLGCITIIIIFGIIFSIVDSVIKVIPIAIIGLGVYIAIGGKSNQKKVILRENELKRLAKNVEENGLPIASTSLILNPRERCYYHDRGSRLITSRMVTSYKGGSTGVSVRIAKGVTLRSGTSRGVPIRNDVTDRFNGEISITNQRIVFLGNKGFEITYGQITAIDYYSDAIAFQVKSNRYIISSPEIDYIQIIVDEVVERYKLRRA